MANTIQARKRARQSEQHRERNASQRSMGRGTIKKVVAAIDAKNKADAQAAYTAMVPVLDRYANRGHRSAPQSMSAPRLPPKS